MIIDELRLKNFRNYEDLYLSLHSGVNFILGHNGVGKTNILEAIAIVANLRSFRNNSDSDIIKWESHSYYCSASIDDEKRKIFEIGYEKEKQRIRKKAKIDGREIQRLSDYYGQLLTVIFSPLDINIINDAPSIRRRFFDSCISKVDREYLTALTEYRKIVAARNSLLKSIRSNGTSSTAGLEVWNQLFAEKMSIILQKRKSFLDRFDDHFIQSYTLIGDDKAPDISYNPKEAVGTIEDILNTCERVKHKEFATGTTAFGPHRDDYKLGNDQGIPFTSYASQGQRRTAAIALKIAEYKLLEEKTAKKCVILVDDIFSELDEKRRKNMIDILKAGNQVIFTMVHSTTINMDAFGAHKVFHVEPGGEVKSP